MKRTRRAICSVLALSATATAAAQPSGLPKPCQVVVHGPDITVDQEAIKPEDAPAKCPAGALVTGDYDANAAWFAYRDAFRRAKITVSTAVLPVDLEVRLGVHHVVGGRSGALMPGTAEVPLDDTLGAVSIVARRGGWRFGAEQPFAMFQESPQTPPSGFRNVRLSIGREETLAEFRLDAGISVTAPTAVGGGAPRDAGIAARFAAAAQPHPMIRGEFVVRAGYNDDLLELGQLYARYADFTAGARFEPTGWFRPGVAAGLFQSYGDTKQLAPHIEVDVRFGHHHRNVAASVLAIFEDDGSSWVVGVRGTFGANLVPATRPL